MRGQLAKLLKKSGSSGKPASSGKAAAQPAKTRAAGGGGSAKKRRRSKSSAAARAPLAVRDAPKVEDEDTVVEEAIGDRSAYDVLVGLISKRSDSVGRAVRQRMQEQAGDSDADSQSEDGGSDSMEDGGSSMVRGVMHAHVAQQQKAAVP